MRRKPPRAQRGYVILIAMIILVMGSIYTFVSQLELVTRKYQRQETTLQVLREAKEALLGYAVTYRDLHPNDVFGYLPCPSTYVGPNPDMLGTADSSCSAGAIGLLPYKTLGLQDLRDADGNCLWYAVSGNFKNSPQIPPLNWDTQGQFTIAGMNMVPDSGDGGAAAVIIAPGPAISGHVLQQDSGPCGVNPAGNGVLASFIESFTAVTNTFTPGSPDSPTNNDTLAWITPKEIFAKIKNRSDFPAFINTGINDIQAKLTNNLGSYAVEAGNMLPVVNPFTANTSDYYFFANWRDNFRYLKCSPANSYCFSINGANCDGVLLFGGLPTVTLNDTASPRPSNKRNASNYFESGATGGLDLLIGSSATVSGAAQAYTAATSSVDIVQCLTQQITPITASQMFDTTNPMLSGNGLVAASGSTLSLGTTSPGASGAVLYGCSWYPTMLPFGNGLRVYFEYQVAQAGEGFTFTVADADPTRNASTAMCGAAGDALGYSGSNGTTTPINYPKIALEIDLAQSTARNDPATSPAMHFAFDYWGTAADADDDVTHGAGGGGGGGSPMNPAGAPGLKQPASSIASGTTVYVRLDIARAYDGGTGQGTYTLDAYVAKAHWGSFPSAKIFCFQSDFKDMTSDLANICPGLADGTYLRNTSDTITINNVAGAAGEAMRRIYIGFTTSQSAGVGQSIGVANFVAATH